MKTFSIIVLILQIIWKPLLQILLIIATIAYLPIINMVTILLSVLIWVLIFKTLKEEPDIIEWGRTILITSLFVIGFWLLEVGLGLLGILGGVLLILCIAAWQIYKNWKLYDYATTWGAKRIFKESKEEFDWNKIKGE